MTDAELLACLRRHPWAIEATLSAALAPPTALIGVAVTAQLESVFDTRAPSRKVVNLRRNARVALAVGGWADGDARTLQPEGLADFPEGTQLQRLQRAYFAAFDDGPERLTWPGITDVRVTPSWARLSDFEVDPPSIREWHLAP